MANLDLADIGTIEKALVEGRPELIISAAAYTAVDQAERDARPMPRLRKKYSE